MSEFKKFVGRVNCIDELYEEGTIDYSQVVKGMIANCEIYLKFLLSEREKLKSLDSRYFKVF